MNKFGFNINWKNSPRDILELGEKCLKTGLYEAIEVTYYENMEGVDTFAYNQAIRQIIGLYHPQVVVHISAFNLSEENMVLRSAILHEVRNCCKYTKELGGREIVVHGGFLSPGMHVPVIVSEGDNPEQKKYLRSWELTVKLMKEICLLAKEYGIIVYTENLNMNHLTTECKSLNRLLDDVGAENLKIVFDIGHCHHIGHDVAENVLEAGKRLYHLHLHDNWGELDEHLPVGEGNIDYEAFVKALFTVAYQGLYMMELFCCTPENLTASRERLLRWLN